MGTFHLAGVAQWFSVGDFQSSDEGSIPPPSTSDGLIIIIGIIELLVCEDR